MRRRRFLTVPGEMALGLAAGLLLPRRGEAAQSRQQVRPRVSLTVDDPDVACTLPWRQANRRFLDTLQSRRLKAALFVCGKRVDGADGSRLVGEWDDAGHAIGNHSYSHLTFLRRTSYEDFAADFVRDEPIVAPYRHRVRLFRYPLLKEGDTAEKRDRFRALLPEHGYRPGHVTIDGSDWYVNQRWLARRQTNAATTPQRYQDFLLTHLTDLGAALHHGYHRPVPRGRPTVRVKGSTHPPVVGLHEPSFLALVRTRAAEREPSRRKEGAS